LARRWISERGAELGALFLWLILALLTSWRLKGTSFLFVLPLLSVTSAAIVKLITKQNRAALIASWGAALIVLTVVTPAIYELAVVPGMGVPGAVVIGLFVPLTAWLLAPQLEALTLPRARTSLLVMAAGGIAVVALGLVAARVEKPRLVQSMLAYALDAESGHAWLVAPSRLARTNSWAASVLGTSRIVVGSKKATSDSAPPPWLRRAIAGEAPTLSASAPRLNIGMPSVSVIADSIRDGKRRLEMHIQPAPATYSIRLRVPSSRIDSATLDGHMIDRAPYRGPTYWSLGYVLPPDAGFNLTLVVKGSEPLEVELIARSLGLPPAIVAATPPRYQGTVPVHAGDQTVVHRLARL
jgi:hypothetical protein